MVTAIFAAPYIVTAAQLAEDSCTTQPLLQLEVQILTEYHCCCVLNPGRLVFCTAAVILAQRSFLQDLVLLKEDRRFWNSFCPEAVHINAWNKDIISKIVLRVVSTCLPGVENDGSEVLVFSRGEVVEPLVDTLVIHLQREARVRRLVRTS